MFNRIRRFFALLATSALLTALVSGCGTNLASRSTSPPLPAGVTSSVPMVGSVQLPKAIYASGAGVPVELRQDDGSLTDSGMTSPTGWFQLRSGFDGRVEARLPGVTLATEVRKTSPGHVWMNVPTTIISRYVRKYPGTSLAEAEAKVRASLRIPTNIPIYSPFGDTWRSWFSYTTFVQAAGATSLDAYIDQAVTRAANGGVQAYRIPHPYPILYRSLHPREAVMFGIEPVTVTKTNRTANADGESTLFYELGVGVGAGEAVIYINKGIGWLCTGLKNDPSNTSSTAAMYAQVNQELTNLQNSVNNLSVQTTTLTQIAACETAANRLRSNFNSFQLDCNTNNPTQAAQVLNSYCGPGGMWLSDLTTLRNNLLGNPSQGVPPLIPNYAALVDSAQFGSQSPSGASMWMDTRTNEALEQVGQVADYYIACVQIGACLQAEYSHLDSNSFPIVASGNTNVFAAHIQEAQTYISEIAADIQMAQQLNAPPTIGSDNVTVTLAEGGIWNTPIMGPASNDNSWVQSYAMSYSLGPWTQSNTWFVPNLAQMQYLRGLASNLGDGNVDKGLAQMGMIAGWPNNVQTSDILCWYSDYDSDIGEYVLQVYNITANTTGSASRKQACNYFLVRGLPGPDEQTGTLFGATYPTSISASVALDLLSGLGIYPPPNPIYNGYTTANQNLSPYLSWSSNNVPSFAISNLVSTNSSDPYQVGSVILHQAIPSGTATASYCNSLTGTAGSITARRNVLTATVSASSFATGTTPVLTSMLVSPYTNNYANTAGNGTLAVNCFATGFFSDGTVKDLTNEVVWSLTSTKGIAEFSLGVPNQLNLYSTEGVDAITITATYNGAYAPTQIQASGSITTSFP